MLRHISKDERQAARERWRYGPRENKNASLSTDLMDGLIVVALLCSAFVAIAVVVAIWFVLERLW